MQKLRLVVFCFTVFILSSAVAVVACGRVLNAKNFGVVGDGVTDDGPAFRKAVAAGVKVGVGARVEFEKKVYRLGPNRQGGEQLRLQGVKDLTIDGNGSTLLLDPRDGAFALRCCTNVVLRGFVLDYQPLTFTQGSITRVNADQGTFDMEIHAGYQLPPADDLVKKVHGKNGWRWGSVLDSKERHLRWGVADHYFIDSVRQVEGRIFRVTVTKPYAAQLKPINPGDRFFLPFHVTASGENNAGHNISVIESTECTVEGITIHSARSGMNYLLSRNEGCITLRNNRIAFKPGCDRICTTWRDGVHCKDNRVGPLIEGCYFEGMLDDSINISANTAMAAKIISNREFILKGPKFGVGDDVMVFDPRNGEILKNTKVLSFKPSGRNSHVVLADPVNGVVAGTKQAHKDIKSTHFYNMSYANSGFIVRNCTFKPQRRHALLVRSSNGVFEGNAVDGVGGAAVWMANEMGGFYEGPFPTNNIIRNNIIRNTQIPSIRIYTSRLGGSVNYTSDITVENNEITSLPGVTGIFVSKADRIHLKDNRVLDEKGKPAGKKAIRIDPSADVSCE